MQNNLVEKTKTKRQHYVPQFLLRKFCDENGKISVYDKKNKKIFKTLPKDICFKDYLYEYETIDCKLSNGKHILPNDIENIYAKEEGEYSRLLDGIINKLKILNNSNALILTSNEIALLYDFMNNLIVRHPNSMGFFLSEESYQNFIDDFDGSEMIDKIFSALDLGKTDGFKRAIYKKSYLNTKEYKDKGVNYTDYFKDMSFVFLEAEEDEFITGDFPIRYEIPDDDNQEYFKSLYFPISPKYAINFFHEKTVDRNRIRKVDKDLVLKINLFNLFNDESRFIIASNKQNIEKILSNYNDKA